MFLRRRKRKKATTEYRFTPGPAKPKFRILMLMAHEEEFKGESPRARLDRFALYFMCLFNCLLIDVVQ